MDAIYTRADFIAWAKERGLRRDWHEPDEQEITARVEGTPLNFDNAMGVGEWYGPGPAHLRHAELHVIFSERGPDEDGKPTRGPDLACVNLATLCAWATGLED